MTKEGVDAGAQETQPRRSERRRLLKGAGGSGAALRAPLQPAGSNAETGAACWLCGWQGATAGESEHTPNPV